MAKGPVEIQRYASNATNTLHLLQSISGVDHANILPEHSNGLKDIFGNPLLNQRDLVIMVNCGFYHACHVKPVLRNMLGLSGVDLVFQPPYHPVFNTCEHCFGFLSERAGCARTRNLPNITLRYQLMIH